MKRALTLIVPVLVIGCTDPCPSATSWIPPVGQGLYKRAGGLSIGAWFTSTPAAGGVVVGNSCDPIGSASQFETAACVTAVDDDHCTACLKAQCCAPTLDWLGGAADADAEVASCVEAHCAVVCTRSQ